MQDIEGQILSVLGRSVTGGRTIYDIAHSSGQKFTTFDAQKAQLAHQLEGQAVTLRFDVTQRPNPRGGSPFTNYNLIDVAPTGQLGAAIAAPAGIPMAGAPAAGIPMAPPSGGGGGGGMTPEREERIMRQNASTAAFTFVGHLYSGTGSLETLSEALSLATQVTEALLAYDKSGAWTGALTSPQAVAGFVNQEVPGGVTVGTGAIAAPDIPWVTDSAVQG